MSSFNKANERKNKTKLGKKRLKEVKSILEELDYVATELIKSKIQITEKNIIKEASKYTDMPLGKIELSILQSKLQSFQDYVNSLKVKQNENNS